MLLTSMNNVGRRTFICSILLYGRLIVFGCVLFFKINCCHTRDIFQWWNSVISHTLCLFKHCCSSELLDRQFYGLQAGFNSYLRIVLKDRHDQLRLRLLTDRSRYLAPAKFRFLIRLLGDIPLQARSNKSWKFLAIGGAAQVSPAANEPKMFILLLSFFASGGELQEWKTAFTLATFGTFFRGNFSF